MQKKVLFSFALIICLNVANALEINHIYRNKRGNYQNKSINLDSCEMMIQSWQILRAPWKMGHMVATVARLGLTVETFT